MIIYFIQGMEAQLYINTQKQKSLTSSLNQNEGLPKSQANSIKINHVPLLERKNQEDKLRKKNLTKKQIKMTAREKVEAGIQNLFIGVNPIKQTEGITKIEKHQNSLVEEFIKKIQAESQKQDKQREKDSRLWKQLLSQLLESYKVEKEYQEEITYFFYLGEIEECSQYITGKGQRKKFQKSLSRVYQTYLQYEGDNWEGKFSELMKKYLIPANQKNVVCDLFVCGEIKQCAQHINKKKRSNFTTYLSIIYLYFVFSFQFQLWKEKLKLLMKCAKVEKESYFKFVSLFVQNEIYQCFTHMKISDSNEVSQQLNQIYQQFKNAEQKRSRQFLEEKISASLQKTNNEMTNENIEKIAKQFLSANVKKYNQVPQFEKLKQIILKFDKFNFCQLKNKQIKLNITVNKVQKQYQIQDDYESFKYFLWIKYPDLNFQSYAIYYLGNAIYSFDNVFAQQNIEEIVLTAQKKKIIKYQFDSMESCLMIDPNQNSTQISNYLITNIKQISSAKIEEGSLLFFFHFQTKKILKTFTRFCQAEAQYGELKIVKVESILFKVHNSKLPVFPERSLCYFTQNPQNFNEQFFSLDEIESQTILTLSQIHNKIYKQYFELSREINLQFESDYQQIDLQVLMKMNLIHCKNFLFHEIIEERIKDFHDLFYPFEIENQFNSPLLPPKYVVDPELTNTYLFISTKTLKDSLLTEKVVAPILELLKQKDNALKFIIQDINAVLNQFNLKVEKLENFKEVYSFKRKIMKNYDEPVVKVSFANKKNPMLTINEFPKIQESLGNKYIYLKPRELLIKQKQFISFNDIDQFNQYITTCIQWDQVHESISEKKKSQRLIKMAIQRISRDLSKMNMHFIEKEQLQKKILDGKNQGKPLQQLISIMLSHVITINCNKSLTSSEEIHEELANLEFFDGQHILNHLKVLKYEPQSISTLKELIAQNEEPRKFRFIFIGTFFEEWLDQGEKINERGGLIYTKIKQYNKLELLFGTVCHKASMIKDRDKRFFQASIQQLQKCVQEELNILNEELKKYQFKLKEDFIFSAHYFATCLIFKHDIQLYHKQFHTLQIEQHENVLSNLDEEHTNKARHLIFVLNDSIALASKWDLIQDSLSAIIDEVKKRDNKKMLISIILFSDSGSILFQRAKPSQIDSSLIEQREGWDTNLCLALDLIFEVLHSPPEDEFSSVFLLSPCDKAMYPADSIEKLTIMKDKFKFFGFQYRNTKIAENIEKAFGSENHQCMNKICKALSGRNIILSSNEDFKVYLSACLKY